MEEEEGSFKKKFKVLKLMSSLILGVKTQHHIACLPRITKPPGFGWGRKKVTLLNRLLISILLLNYIFNHFVSFFFFALVFPLFPWCGNYTYRRLLSTQPNRPTRSSDTSCIFMNWVEGSVLQRIETRPLERLHLLIPSDKGLVWT